MKVEARLTKEQKRPCACRLFLSSSHLRSSLSWRVHEGRRREEEPGITSRTWGRNATIVCTVRAFDFSRRNDYAIISRRVPFLLKRKTSPLGSPQPLCNISGGETLPRSLAYHRRVKRAPFLTLSLSLIQSTLHPFVTIRADVPSSAGSVHFRPTGQPLHTPLTHSLTNPTHKGPHACFRIYFYRRHLFPTYAYPVCVSIPFYFPSVLDRRASSSTRL